MVDVVPFQTVRSEADTKLYVSFLSGEPAHIPDFPLHASAEALETIGMKNLNVFTVSRKKKNGFFGFPNPVVEKTLGGPSATRNWSTVSKLVRKFAD